MNLLSFQMEVYVVAIILAYAETRVIIDDERCLRIRGNYYQKEVLKNNVQNPYQLAIDYNTETLFYSYSARENYALFKTASLNLQTGVSTKVFGIRGGFANAVDNINQIVYMGGEDGIYAYDYNTDSAISLNIKNDENIWQMFYDDDDGLYFTTYPDEQVYLYTNDEVFKVSELEEVRVMLIAVDRNNNLLYFNSSGVFMYETDERKYTYLSDVVANGVTSDIDGNIVFSTAYGINYFNDTLKQIVSVVTIGNIYGVAIPQDGNIIYATENSIIKIKPSTIPCISRIN